MLGYKPIETLIDPKHNLKSAIESTAVDKGPCHRLVGKLIYLFHTRTDIAFAASVVSQYMHFSCETHMKAILKFLQYLKSTFGKDLLFSNNHHLQIETYIDVDYVGSIDDRKSMSGFCTLVGDNLVTWRNKK